MRGVPSFASRLLPLLPFAFCLFVAFCFVSRLVSHVSRLVSHVSKSPHNPDPDLLYIRQ
jgi:hypothetical protein